MRNKEKGFNSKNRKKKLFVKQDQRQSSKSEMETFD